MTTTIDTHAAAAALGRLGGKAGRGPRKAAATRASMLKHWELVRAGLRPARRPAQRTPQTETEGTEA